MLTVVKCSLVNAAESNPAERSRVLQRSVYIADVIAIEKGGFGLAMLMCSDLKERRGRVKEVALKMSAFLSFSRLITSPRAASIHSRV